MIAAQHLTKTFGRFVAVSDISFEIKRGEIAAFLGPNGAGKTTTIKMPTTLLKPTSGRIELDGLNPGRQPGEVRKRSLLIRPVTSGGDGDSGGQLAV